MITPIESLCERMRERSVRGRTFRRGGLRFLDRVAHLLLPAIREIVISHGWEAKASVLPRTTPRVELHAVATRANRAAGRERREPAPTVTRADRERAERAKRAIRALQIAGLWPV